MWAAIALALADHVPTTSTSFSDRMLELAPLFWERTRARLDAVELAIDLGPITVPVEPLDTSATPKQRVAAATG